MLLSVQEEFPNAELQGCFFHFIQAIMKHVCNAGFKVQYENDADFPLKVRHLVALAFLPVNDVEEAFDEYQNIMVHFTMMFYFDGRCYRTYFEDTRISRPRRNRSRVPPDFDIVMWNCHDATLLDLPKTNNMVEGWHHALNNLLDCSHANIYKLLGALKKEQSLTEAGLEQEVAGHRPAKRRRV